jgi:hypothetical protein
MAAENYLHNCSKAQEASAQIERLIPAPTSCVDYAGEMILLIFL